MEQEQRAGRLDRRAAIRVLLMALTVLVHAAVQRLLLLLRRGSSTEWVGLRLVVNIRAYLALYQVCRAASC